MKLKQIIACCITLSILGSMHAQVIPNQMEFCGMTLVFSPDAKRKLASYVGKIYESPRYFNKMVNKADTYMPFITEAFKDVGIPEDLKFLAIQESGLKSDAVSTSKAIGFWQLKRDAALEVGLRIDAQIDERKHIYRASAAAARYLAKANKDFDNWVYALIAYYEGLTGAVPHTEPKYYGKNRMMIDGDIHWYALKAIAHKIAYEEALAMGTAPELWLHPFSSEGEIQIKKLYEKHEIEAEEFYAYNTWMTDRKRLPRGSNFTYYIPRSRESYTGHRPDPCKAPQLLITSENPVSVKPESISEESGSVYEKPAPAPTQTVISVIEQDSYSELDEAVTNNAYAKSLFTDRLSSDAYARFDLRQDLHFGIDYVQFEANTSVAEIANRYRIRLRNLLLWNGISPNEEPKQGSILYLVKPRKAKFHVVTPGESLAMIAFKHERTIEQIQLKNRMQPDDYRIYVGQKLYLKKKKPRNEKLIVFDWDFPGIRQSEKDPAEPSPKIVEIESITPREVVTEGVSDANVEIEVVPEVRSKWVTHIVQAGESLWKISQLYDTKVEIIKRINELSNDNIYEGQVLRILARIE